MRDIMQLRYFLYHSDHPINKDHTSWNDPIPMNRKGGLNPGSVPFAYGDYFRAARSFLEEHIGILTGAISERLGREIRPEEIETLDICLEKHGEFYHPARIEAVVNGSGLYFVLNAAFSDAGRAGIRKEYETLKRLNYEFPLSFIPQVYGYGKVSSGRGQDIRMFLGEWFEGYHEFHISRDQKDGTEKIMVWDSESCALFLTPEQTRSLYAQIAQILTYYYNVETFEQIWPWRHAAGDFVVSLQDNHIRLKLITVRGYLPMAHNNKDDDDPGTILNALLIFLVNLSLIARLDRLDGVGDMAWADPIAVEGIIEGFFKALESKPLLPGTEVPLSDGFRYYLSICTKTDLYELSQAILENYTLSESAFIQKRLNEHTAALKHEA